jgi:hypothetical protein
MDTLYIVQWSDPKDISLYWHEEYTSYALEFAQDVILTQTDKFPNLDWRLLARKYEVLENFPSK